MIPRGMQKGIGCCKIWQSSCAIIFPGTIYIGLAEFVIVTPGTTEEKMRGKTREIKDAMQKESFSFAIGYAVSDHRGIQQAAIRADQRMYQDKREYYQNHPRYR